MSKICHHCNFPELELSDMATVGFVRREEEEEKSIRYQMQKLEALR